LPPFLSMKALHCKSAKPSWKEKVAMSR